MTFKLELNSRVRVDSYGMDLNELQFIWPPIRKNTRDNTRLSSTLKHRTENKLERKTKHV